MSLASFQNPASSFRPRSSPSVSEVSEETVRYRLFLRLLERGLQTEDELWSFIWLFLGYAVPRHKVCVHHQSPFQFIADQFFERVRTVFGWACRNGGKTLCVAILNVCEALFKPGIEILSSAAIRDQTNKGYDYVTRMLLNNEILGGTVVSSLRSETEFFNGSILRLTTGTFWGMNSQHPTKTRIDECELIHWSVLQQGLQMSISSADGKWKASDCLTSTRKFSSGTVQRLLDQAEAKRMDIRAWCIWDVLEPCPRLCKGDPVYGDCPAYSHLDKDGNEELICGGRAHELPPGGFYRITDFIEKVSVLDKDTWETEWLCLRPHGGALVYGDYFKDEAPFVVPTAEAVILLKRAKEEGWVRCVGLDFGSNFYACFLTQDPASEIWYVYSEYWWQATSNDKPLSEHGTQVKAHDLLGWHNRTQVFADPAGRQAIRDLEGPDVGLFCTPANNPVYEGVNYVKKLFRRRQSDGLPGLRIFHSVTRLRLELSRLYVHKLEKSGEVNRDVIIKRDDHGVDSLRYALFSFETVGTGRYRMKKLRGVWQVLLGIGIGLARMI